METSLLSREIDDFIVSQVCNRGLDERTARAYQIDLEHLHRWLAEHEIDIGQEKAAEKYLEYLVKDGKLKISTITRKYRVLGYYLEYLSKQGILNTYYRIQRPVSEKKEEGPDHILSKAETDAFFAAISREYENLDNDFRRRICLRDGIMMKLLFYHEIEISELLRLKVCDYDRRTGDLVIQGKRTRGRSVHVFSRNLREQIDQWLAEHEYFEREGSYEDRMFLSKLGRPLSMKMVINIFDKYRMLAGIEKECKPRDLKNSLDRYARELMMEQG